MLEKKVQSVENNLFEINANYIVDCLIHGKHLGSSKGFSSEFKEYKTFQTGENIRSIDWKIFGKTDKLYTKHFYNDASMNVYFILDASSSMFYPSVEHSKLKRGLEIIAVLCKLLHQQNDAFSVIVISDKLEINSPLSSSLANLKSIYSKLEFFYQHSENQIETKYIKCIDEIIPSIKRKSKLFFLTDLMLSVEDAKRMIHQLAELKSLSHDVQLLHIHHDSEITKNDEIEIAELIDLESRITYQINPNDWPLFLSKLNDFKNNKIIIPLLEKGIKVKSILTNNSLLENIRSIF